jgi:hypothetical protein
MCIMYVHCVCESVYASCFLLIIPMSCVGRAWKACELRLKSWEDLHKLWYVLLREKNMLLTQKHIMASHNLMFPNPERLPKVCGFTISVECRNMHS